MFKSGKIHFVAFIKGCEIFSFRLIHLDMVVKVRNKWPRETKSQGSILPGWP